MKERQSPLITFSVIIPVYQVERFLNRCMESIVSQTYRNLEIIMVDDGSPDGCPALCEEWKRKDNRIQVIHKENEGLGLARNTGLMIATGDYVAFVDSDDYLMPELFLLAERKLNKTNADICCFGHGVVGPDGKAKSAPMDYPQEITGARIVSELLPRTCGARLETAGKTYSLVPAWSSLYRLAFLQENNLRFERIVSEDKLFNIQAFYHARSVLFLARPLYMYCENSASLTKSYRSYLFDAACDLYARQKALIGQWKLEAAMRHAVAASFLTHVHACLKQESRSLWNTDRHKAKQRMKAICRAAATQEAIRCYPMGKVRWEKRIFYWCIQMRCVCAVRWMLRMNDALEARRPG